MSTNAELSHKSIREFIEGAHTPGALLVTGAWGSGKTFFLKGLADEFNKKTAGIKYAMVIVSLFGLDSAEAIEKAVKKELCYVFAKVKDKKKNKLKEKTGSFLNGLKVIAENFKDDFALANGVDQLLNLSYLDFIDLSSEMLGRKVVVVFDDFERCPILSSDPELLLGIINEYSENKRIKVMIMADISKINGNKKDDEESDAFITFDTFKEKVIYKTIQLENDPSAVIKALISEKEVKNEKYQSFLSDSLDLLKNTFLCSGFNNYRSVSAAIIDFEKLFSIFSEKTSFRTQEELEDYEKEALRFMLEQFFALTLESRSGTKIYKELCEYASDITLIENDEDGNEHEIIVGDDQDKLPEFTEKYSYGLFDNVPENIVQWIEKGIYDEEEIKRSVSAIIDLKKPPVQELYKSFLSTDLYHLEDEIFDSGVTEALNKAYSGDLTSEEYLSLLNRLDKAKEAGIALPVTPDYKKIEKGFDGKNRIYEEEPVFAPNIRIYSGINSNNVEAKALFNKVNFFVVGKRKKLKEKDQYYKNCLTFLKDCSRDQEFLSEAGKNSYIELNDEIINALTDSFRKASNSDRCKITNFFFNIRFTNNDHKEMSDKLIDKLNEMQNEPGIGKIGSANLKDLIETVEKRFRIIMPNEKSEYYKSCLNGIEKIKEETLTDFSDILNNNIHIEFDEKFMDTLINAFMEAENHAVVYLSQFLSSITFSNKGDKKTEETFIRKLEEHKNSSQDKHIKHYNYLKKALKSALDIDIPDEE